MKNRCFKVIRTPLAVNQMLYLTKRMTYIDLSKYPDYMDQYTTAQFLPHTDLSYFPTVQVMMKKSEILLFKHYFFRHLLVH